MSDPSLSLSASLLRPLVQPAMGLMKRLHAESQAGQVPTGLSPNLLEKILNETLDRLRGGKIEDTWWSNLLNCLGQQYIAPQFLKKPALQEWLTEEQVGDDLKILASTRIMRITQDEDEIRSRLAQSYLQRTGEARELADGPINVVVAVLVAGYIASIPSNQRPIAGMVQRVSEQVEEISEQLSEMHSSPRNDPITQQAHTEKATQELDQILVLRAFDLPRARKNIQELWARVNNEGALAAASDSVKNKILFWATSLCASYPDTRDLARQLRAQLRQVDTNIELSIIDALLAVGEGNEKEALRLLRDHDDPDFRTVFFSVLSQFRGESDALNWFQQQDGHNNPQFFTSVGWRNWALYMAKEERWEEACQRLIKFESFWSEMPALAVIEGVINAAMLLPKDYREKTLETVPLFQSVASHLVAQAENHHSRATICFKFAEQNLQDIADHKLARFISDWRLWLRLMDPNVTNSNDIRDEIRQNMEEGAKAVELILFAWTFNIPFNVEPIKQYLEQRKQFGGLNEHELLAQGLLFERSMTPRDLAIYLEEHGTRLSKVMHPALVITMHVDALVRDGQIAKARKLVAEHAAELGEEHTNRLNVMINIEEGDDPREQLERLYRETGSLVDLQNLISHLKIIGDRTALQPLTRELFDRTPTVENAHGVVRNLSDPSFFDHAAVIDFLEANPEILEQSDDLKTAKAWALFHAGRLQESREINDILIGQRANQNDLRLDINIAVCSGDWERIAAIIDREWDRRDSHDSETLMNLARLESQRGQTPDRALQLAKLAAEKAPDKPEILAAAYWLHFQLGRDNEADPNWLARASELSSPEKGPLQRVTLQDLVTEWIPKREEYVREVERKWLKGEIPMSLAASRFNMPLSRLLLHIPDQNTEELDGRRRIILPIIAGVRNPITLNENWTIGLDVTSNMVLAHLGLLKTTVDALHHVKLAPDMMEHLLRERDAVRFHQPSRIEAAKQVRELQSRGRLRAVEDLDVPPQAITEEVGLELAALFEMARHDEGKVVCTLPIHKVSSLMEQQADTSEYDNVIISVLDFCTLLHQEGKIDAADFQRAKLFLNRQGQIEHSNPSPSILKRPIYIDNLALTYLQNARILQPIASAGLDIRIHPNVLQEMDALIAAGDMGNALASKIEGIRNTLRNALESGAASFLPRAADQNMQVQEHEIQFRATASLLAGSSACDALCIDDRYINSNPAIENPAKRSVPILCVVDVLRHLRSRGSLSTNEYWEARHKLRRSGFAFIPLESDELVYWFMAAKVVDGQLTESAELRIIRQAMARVDSLPTSEEALTLSLGLQRTCKATIGHLWEDASLTIERTTVLSDWVWRHLMAMTFLGSEQIEKDGSEDWIQKLISPRLGHLLLPTATLTQERRAHYTHWLDRSVFEFLRPANSDTVEKELSSTCDAISALENDWEVYGALFLGQLPESVRRVVMTQEPEFASRCGFETRRVFSIGPDIKLAENELFAAAREILSTNEESSIQDISGKDVPIDLDGEHQTIIVRWSDAESVSHQVPIPDLALLSPNQEARLNTLGDIIDRLGPTAEDFRYLLEEIGSRELTHQELSAILDESANGIAAIQTNMVQNLSVGVVDFIPQSVSYFERFAGPNPFAREPEAYFQEILIPYRKALLQRDLKTGLDICCLGALRDDLTPGQWVVDIDNDTVWNALSSCYTKINPFSLLGALDVALYRLEDPRFREFSAEAVDKLLDENFGQCNGRDIYKVLQISYNSILNQINFLESGANYSGYWKRMCAWMQAGLIVRVMTESSVSVDIDDLEQWTHSRMTPAGVYALLVDARKEPMFFVNFVPLQDLRNEIFGRLALLKLRHENEGRQIPKSEDINHALARPEARGYFFPGPLGGHRRPTKPITQDIDQFVKTWPPGNESLLLQWLVEFSQIFALGEAELERAREVVKMTTENILNANSDENLKCLDLASVVAAANRDTMLADEIAVAVSRAAARISEGKEVQSILRIILQAAAAHGEHGAWFKWLEEKLASIASHLPPPPNKCLRMFMDHLDELGKILPADSWFHIRARSIASAGME